MFISILISVASFGMIVGPITSLLCSEIFPAKNMPYLLTEPDYINYKGNIR
jgi:hypothetical protein